MDSNNNHESLRASKLKMMFQKALEKSVDEAFPTEKDFLSCFSPDLQKDPKAKNTLSLLYAQICKILIQDCPVSLILLHSDDIILILFFFFSPNSQNCTLLEVCKDTKLFERLATLETLIKQQEPFIDAQLECRPLSQTPEEMLGSIRMEIKLQESKKLSEFVEKIGKENQLLSNELQQKCNELEQTSKALDAQIKYLDEILQIQDQ